MFDFSSFCFYVVTAYEDFSIQLKYSLFYAGELQCQINKKQISCDLFQKDRAQTFSNIYT